MPKFTRKPMVVEAFRLGQKGHPTPVPEWFGSLNGSDIIDEGIYIYTLMGKQLVRWGDWIIKGENGWFYSMQDNVFEATFDLVY